MVPRNGTYHQKPTASCEAAQLWVRTTTPTTIVPRSGTDISTMILRTIHRSRFAEPRECEEVCLPTAALLRILQWVSDRYVSPLDTAPLILSYSNRGRQPPKHRTTKEPQAAGQTQEAMASRRSHAPTNIQALAESSHANIVQRVKSCYKIKINSRESKSCFYGFFQHKSHPR